MKKKAKPSAVPLSPQSCLSLNQSFITRVVWWSTAERMERERWKDKLNQGYLRKGQESGR